MVLHLAVDTGATQTMINVGLLAFAGYDPSLVPDRVQVTTGSGVEYAPRVPVERIQALGQERQQFPVLAHTRLRWFSAVYVLSYARRKSARATPD